MQAHLYTNRKNILSVLSLLLSFSIGRAQSLSDDFKQMAITLESLTSSLVDPMPLVQNIHIQNLSNLAKRLEKFPRNQKLTKALTHLYSQIYQLIYRDIITPLSFQEDWSTTIHQQYDPLLKGLESLASLAKEPSHSGDQAFKARFNISNYLVRLLGQMIELFNKIKQASTLDSTTAIQLYKQVKEIEGMKAWPNDPDNALKLKQLTNHLRNLIKRKSPTNIVFEDEKTSSQERAITLLSELERMEENQQDFMESNRNDIEELLTIATALYTRAINEIVTMNDLDEIEKSVKPLQTLQARINVLVSKHPNNQYLQNSAELKEWKSLEGLLTNIYKATRYSIKNNKKSAEENLQDAQKAAENTSIDFQGALDTLTKRIQHIRQ